MRNKILFPLIVYLIYSNIFLSQNFAETATSGLEKTKNITKDSNSAIDRLNEFKSLFKDDTFLEAEGIRIPMLKAINHMLEENVDSLEGLSKEELVSAIAKRSTSLSSLGNDTALGALVMFYNIPSIIIFEVGYRMKTEGAKEGAMNAHEVWMLLRPSRADPRLCHMINTTVFLILSVFFINKYKKKYTDIEYAQLEMIRKEQREKWEQARKWKRDKKKWVKLQKGDSQASVSSIFGKPDSVGKRETASGQEIWIYDYGAEGKRTVTFKDGFIEKVEVEYLDNNSA